MDVYHPQFELLGQKHLPRVRLDSLAKKRSKELPKHWSEAQLFCKGQSRYIVRRAREASDHVVVSKPSSRESSSSSSVLALMNLLPPFFPNTNYLGDDEHDENQRKYWFLVLGGGLFTLNKPSAKLSAKERATKREELAFERNLMKLEVDDVPLPLYADDTPPPSPAIKAEASLLPHPSQSKRRATSPIKDSPQPGARVGHRLLSRSPSVTSISSISSTSSISATTASGFGSSASTAGRRGRGAPPLASGVGPSASTAGRSGRSAPPLPPPVPVLKHSKKSRAPTAAQAAALNARSIADSVERARLAADYTAAREQEAATPSARLLYNTTTKKIYEDAYNSHSEMGVREMGKKETVQVVEWQDVVRFCAGQTGRMGK
ncbi:hypothetical protein B0H15DRAFT_804827 [Mycena belliarum]|uniref:Uncharacterized protein n=1 Tax=Mycena belliarum TaxID=1033014 RepID=A0AAD6XPC2_9AGAR|nr:hypothetical protein B0H15DRAFT_804827 [Mycena belliae]